MDLSFYSVFYDSFMLQMPGEQHKSNIIVHKNLVKQS